MALDLGGSGGAAAAKKLGEKAGEQEAENPEAAEGAATQARGGVYVLKDAAGNVVRTGRTDDLARRQAEHAREYPDYSFEPVYRTDDPLVRRGLEQILYDLNPEAALNKIRAISQTNPRIGEYLDAAKRFLFGGGSQ